MEKYSSFPKISVIKVKTARKEKEYPPQMTKEDAFRL